MDTNDYLSFVEKCFDRNETGDAELWASLYKDKICYSVEENTWFVWNGRYWEPDTKEPVTNLIANDVAECYMWASGKFLEQSQKYDDSFHEKAMAYSNRGYSLRGTSKINSILKRARDNKDFITTSEDWELDPMELPVNNGIVNLKDGSFREGKPQDYIRCPCPVDWEGLDKEALTFEKFVFEIFDNDEDMVKSVQRILGYSLTGEQTEHILPIMVGDGGNGKDTLFKALQSVLGELAGPVGSEIMIYSRSNNYANNAAFTLRFKRLAYVSETGNGSYLDGNRVKQLTGGGKIQAKQLYKDPLSFDQQHTLFLMTNHMPRTDAEDNAIWRRILVIEFPLSFVDNPTQDHERQVDKHLSEKLRDERSGIMAWLVRGCLDWQKQGLKPCQAILDAVNEYREGEDIITQFIDEEMEVKPDARITKTLLYQYYQEWAQGNGLRPLSKIRLGKKLSKRFQDERTTIDGKTERFWIGLDVVIDEEMLEAFPNSITPCRGNDKK